MRTPVKSRSERPEQRLPTAVPDFQSPGVSVAFVCRDQFRDAKRPFPRAVEDDKYLVWGRGSSGRLLQVVFVVDDNETLFVIHARPLTEREKKRWAKRG